MAQEKAKKLIKLRDLKKMPKAAVGAVAVATAITGFNKEWPLESRTVVRSHGAIVHIRSVLLTRQNFDSLKFKQL